MAQWLCSCSEVITGHHQGSVLLLFEHFFVRNTILWYTILVCCQASVFFPGCCWWTRHQCGLVPHDYAGNLLWLVCSNFPLISLHKKNSFRNSILFSECAAQRTSPKSIVSLVWKYFQVKCNNAHILIFILIITLTVNRFSVIFVISSYLLLHISLCGPIFRFFDISSQTWGMATALKPKTTELENWSFIFFLFRLFLFLKGPCKSCALYLRSGVHCFTA